MPLFQGGSLLLTGLLDELCMLDFLKTKLTSLHLQGVLCHFLR